VTLPLINGVTGIVKKFYRTIKNRNRKRFNGLIKNSDYAWNFTHNTESTAV
jgi:hypothetical protein